MKGKNDLEAHRTLLKDNNQITYKNKEKRQLVTTEDVMKWSFWNFQVKEKNQSLILFFLYKLSLGNQIEDEGKVLYLTNKRRSYQIRILLLCNLINYKGEKREKWRGRYWNIRNLIGSWFKQFINIEILFRKLFFCVIMVFVCVCFKEYVF